MPAHLVPAVWQEVEYQIPVHLKSEIDALIEPYLASAKSVASPAGKPAVGVTTTPDGYLLKDSTKDITFEITVTPSGRPRIRQL